MNQRSQSHPSEVTRRRLIALIAGYALGFIALLVRLRYLQVIKGERFATLSESNRLRIIPRPDIRGQIIDRYGKALANSRRSFSVSLLPEDTPKLDLLIPRLKDRFPIRWEEVDAKLRSAQAYRTIPLLKDLNPEQVAYVAEHRWDLPGLSLDVEHVRHYHYHEVAAHIVGYTGEINEDQLRERQEQGYRMGDYIGQAGVEKMYESALRGTRGAREVEVDALGRELQLAQDRDPGPGFKLVLTLDLALQQVVEDELAGQAGAILVQSCDVFFYWLGQRLGIDTIARYAKGFGLGAPTGFDPAHEKPGLVPSTAWKRTVRGEPWYPGETISAAIGQGYNLVTPIQLLNVISAVANGGTLYKPQIAKRLETPDGQVVQTFAPQRLGEIPARAETLRLVQQALWGVVNEPHGTGWRAHLEGVNIAGKTGTVQVIANAPKGARLPERFRDHGWFVAFAPVENPQLALVIFGEHGGRGGSTYAPIARQIIAHYFKLSPTLPPQTPTVARRPAASWGMSTTSAHAQPVNPQH